MSEAVKIQNVTKASKIIVTGNGTRVDIPPMATVIVMGDLSYFKKCIVAGLRGIVVTEHTGGEKIPLLESKVSEEVVLVDITNKTNTPKLLALGTGARIELNVGEVKRVEAKLSVVKAARGVQVRRVKKAGVKLPVGLTPPITVSPVVPVDIPESVSEVLEARNKLQAALEQEAKRIREAEKIPTQKFDGASDTVTIGKPEATEEQIASMAQEIDEAYDKVKRDEKVGLTGLSQTAVEMQAQDPENRPVWEQLVMPEHVEEFWAKVNSGEYNLYDLRGFGSNLTPKVSARSRQDLAEKVAAAVYGGVER